MAYFDFESMKSLNPGELQLRNTYLEACRELEKRTGQSAAQVIQNPDDLCAFLSEDGQALLARIQDNGTPMLKPLYSVLTSTRYSLEVGYQLALQRRRQQGLSTDYSLEEYACNVRTYLHGRYTPLRFHDHDFFELVFVLTGNAIHFVGNTKGRAILGPGDIALIPPGIQHAPYVFSDNCLLLNVAFGKPLVNRYSSILLNDNLALAPFFRRALEGNLSSESFVMLHAGDYFYGDNYLAEIYRHADEDTFYGAEHRRAALIQLLLTLDERLSKAGGMEFSLGFSQTDPVSESLVISYIRTHFDTVTRAELADVFNYSERQITRLVRNETGLSFSDYQRQLRMNYIAFMLRNSYAPIKQIVESAGYTQNSYFFKLFRSIYGVTPAEYREQNASNTLQ